MNKATSVSYTNDGLSMTADENGVPTDAPAPKVLSAAIGAGAGAAVTTIGVWIFESATGIDIPALVEGAILTLATLGVSFLAGYVKRPVG